MAGHKQRRDENAEHNTTPGTKLYHASRVDMRMAEIIRALRDKGGSYKIYDLGFIKMLIDRGVMLESDIEDYGGAPRLANVGWQKVRLAAMEANRRGLIKLYTGPSQGRAKNDVRCHWQVTRAGLVALADFDDERTKRTLVDPTSYEI